MAAELTENAAITDDYGAKLDLILRRVEEFHALIEEFRPLLDAYRRTNGGQVGLWRARKAARNGR